VVVAVNRGEAPAAARLEAPAEWGSAPVEDVWNGEEIARPDGAFEVTVAGRGARILAVRRPPRDA
jgi:hypothetical protein